MKLCHAVAIAAVLAAGMQGVPIKYQWTQGDVLTYRTALETSSTISGMPNAPADVKIEQTMTQTVRMLVAAVAPDGTATIQQTIEAVKLEMGNQMGKTRYDSADPGSGAGSEGAELLKSVFGGMVGGRVTVVMTSAGKVQRIVGAAQLLDKILIGLPRDPRAEQMAQGLRSVLSDDAMRASLEQSFPAAPPQPIKAGDTWNGQVALGSDTIGKVTGSQVFTVKAIDGDVATMTVALTLKQESVSPVGPAGMLVKLEGGHGEGEVRFNTAKGRLERSTMTTEMPTTISMRAPDGQPVTMKNATKTSMTMELVSK